MASKRHQRRRACEGKKRHRSPHAALLAVRGTLRQIDERYTIVSASDRNLHAYHCPHCGFWHVGHPAGSTAGARRRKDMPKHAFV